MLGMRKDNALPNTATVVRKALVISQKVLPTGGRTKSPRKQSKRPFRPREKQNSTRQQYRSLSSLIPNLLARRASKIHELPNDPTSVAAFECWARLLHDSHSRPRLFRHPFTTFGLPSGMNQGRRRLGRVRDTLRYTLVCCARWPTSSSYESPTASGF